MISRCQRQPGRAITTLFRLHARSKYAAPELDSEEIACQVEEALVSHVMLTQQRQHIVCNSYACDLRWQVFVYQLSVFLLPGCIEFTGLFAKGNQVMIHFVV